MRGYRFGHAFDDVVKKTNAYVTFETDRAPDYRMGSFYVSSEAGDVEATAALCVEVVPFF